MKYTKIFFTAIFILFVNLLFSQETPDTLKPAFINTQTINDTAFAIPSNVNWFSPFSLKPQQNSTYLYPGPMVLDTISQVEFTWITKNGNLKYQSGYLVQSSQVWLADENNEKSVVIKKVKESFILADYGKRYEIKIMKIGSVIYTSNTVRPKGIKRLFTLRPRFVWDIRLI